MNRDDMTKVLPFGRIRRVPDPARVAAFGAIARKLVQEKVDSTDQVLRVLRETPREEWSARPELQNTGALQQLGRQVEAHLDSEPQTSLAIAEAATRTAELLPDDSYPPLVLAQSRAIAWKDRAQALCYLGRYEEALTALDRADAYLEHFGALSHDVGIVRFVRATVLQHLRRFDEAQGLLEECRVIFRDHGDIRLYARCALAAGNLLVRRGDYRAAQTTLAPLAAGDQVTLIPLARMALGWCAIHLGQPAEALEHFVAAARELQATRELEAVRALYGAGSALLHLGRFDEAVTRLRSTRDSFLSRGLVEEAGLSGLEIVEAQMALGEIVSARTLAASLVHEFTAANLNRRAVAALAYLNEAIAASSATPEFVRTVHTYITELRTDPSREFAAAN